MFKVNSVRAQELLNQPLACKGAPTSEMRKYPGSDFNLWVGMEIEAAHVKKLSFSGELSPGQQLILEAMAAWVARQGIKNLDTLTVRECEAFLRDRNSQPAFEGMAENDEEKFKKLFQWIKRWPAVASAESYHFHSEKGPFAGLKLVDKVKELKAFLGSAEVAELYQGQVRPELVDVEELTVYVHAPYHSAEECRLFEELHMMGVEAFQEESLNFIPES